MRGGRRHPNAAALAWRAASALAGSALWWWLGAGQAHTQPGGDAQWWLSGYSIGLPGWPDAALSGLLLLLAVVGPVAGRLLPAVLFAAAAATLTRLTPWSPAADTWLGSLSWEALLAAGALVVYLLTVRAAALALRAERMPAHRVEPSQHGRPVAALLGRAVWKCSLVAGPLLWVVVAALGAAAAFRLGAASQAAWAPRVAEAVGSSLAATYSPGLWTLAAGLAVGTGLWLVLSVAREVARLALPASRQLGTYLGAIWNGFTATQALAIERAVRNLERYKEGRAAFHVRRGLVRAGAALGVAALIYGLAAWLGRGGVHVLGMAETWAGDVGEWLRNLDTELGARLDAFLRGLFDSISSQGGGG